MNDHKSPMGLVDLEFVAKMADGLAEGIKDGRTANDWKDREIDPIAYVSALLRHVRDRDWPAVANNAMILEHHKKQEAGALQGVKWAVIGEDMTAHAFQDPFHTYCDRLVNPGAPLLRVEYKTFQVLCEECQKCLK